MPVMNGLDAAYELKRILPAVPIIMYTSYAGASLRRVAEAAGIANVVDKASPHNLLASSVRCLHRAPEDSSEALSLKLF